MLVATPDDLSADDGVEEEEWEPAGDEGAHDESQDESGPTLLLPRYPLPFLLRLLFGRQFGRRLGSCKKYCNMQIRV